MAINERNIQSDRPAVLIRQEAGSGSAYPALDVRQRSSAAPAIRGAGAGDLLDLRNSSGTAMLRVGQTGSMLTRGGHDIRSRFALAASAQGYGGEVYPRMNAGTSSTPTSGDQRGTLCGLFAGEVITNIYCQVTAVGTNVTLAKAGIWNTSGTLLASTADLSSSQFASGTGIKGGALSSPYTVTADGGYYIGFIFVASSSPTILRNANVTGNTGAGVGSGVPFAFAHTGQSDITNATVTASNLAHWFGWS